MSNAKSAGEYIPYIPVSTLLGLVIVDIVLCARHGIDFSVVDALDRKRREI